MTDADTLIVRLSGEIGVKSEWTRRIYEKKLIENIKFALKTENQKPAKIIRARGRIYIKTPTASVTAKTLSRIFGISSVSPAKQTTSELTDIIQMTLATAEAAIGQDQSFAVRCHRVGTHNYSSQDICRKLGEKILEQLEHQNPKVNLTCPNVTVSVEVRDKEAYIYTETLPAHGGYPLGTQAKTICLLSGGIDSPVACWLAMKRGSPQIPVYIDNAPYTDESTKKRAIETANKLKQWSTGHIRKIYIVPNGDGLKAIQEKAIAKFTCLLCKRLMYRIAESIADKENAYGIITGEAIGEQASQTMHNLYVINQAASKYPIHRPLLGFDKLETEAIAKRIGTYEVSISKAKGCAAAPNMPATQAKLTAIKEAEEKLDVSSLVEDALAKTEVLYL